MIDDLPSEEIDVIHAKYEAQLTPVREKLNAALKNTWQEWGVPREADPKWPPSATALHTEWWKLRMARQKEIDASIARRADSRLASIASINLGRISRCSRHIILKRRIVTGNMGQPSGPSGRPTKIDLICRLVAHQKWTRIGWSTIIIVSAALMRRMTDDHEP